MTIYYMESTFTAALGAASAEELGDRVEALYASLLDNETIESVDILTEGTSTMHMLMAVDGDGPEDVAQRGDAALKAAFEAADMKLGNTIADATAEDRATVREFAMA